MSHCLCHECRRPAEGRAIEDSQSAAAILRPVLRYRRVEFFYVACLDVKLRVVGKPVCVGQGSLSACLVHPREVLVPAVRRRAHAIVVGHCHPSGDPTPSDEDFALTRRLVEASKVVGIRLLDHIIIGGTDYYSFADAGKV